MAGEWYGVALGCFGRGTVRRRPRRRAAAGIGVAVLLLAAGSVWAGSLGAGTFAAGEPLHAAARANDAAAVRACVDAGQDVEALDAEGMTPLHCAAAEGSLEAARALLAAGADLGARGRAIASRTPLHIAAQNGQTETVSLLLDNGAELESKDSLEFTPLGLAATEGHSQTVALLLARGADVDARNEWLWTPLHCACQEGAAEAARLLVEYGADLGALSDRNHTPVYLALRVGNAAVLAAGFPDTAATREAEALYGAAGKVLVAVTGAELRPLTVRVVRAGTDEPLPGATVSFTVQGVSGEAQTDGGGLCVVPVPGAIRDSGAAGQTRIRVSLRAGLAGMACAAADWAAADGPGLPSEVLLGLEPARPIGGRVTDEKGRGIEGVIVTVSAVARQRYVPHTYGAVSLDAALTDAKGRWRCEAAPAHMRSAAVHLAHADYVDCRASVREVSGLYRMSSVLRMEAGVAVEGVVLDEEGAPIAGAYVSWEGRSGQEDGQAPTDLAGRFRLTGVAAGTRALAAREAGFVSVVVPLALDRGPGPVEIRLPRAGRLAGRVVDERADPLAEAQVWVTWQYGRNGPSSWSTLTDELGRFECSSFPEGKVSVVASMEGFTSQRAEVVPEERREAVVLTLARQARVTGAVVDAETGEPVPRFWILPGRTVAPGLGVRWEHGQRHAFGNGSYSLPLDVGADMVCIGVEAEGYQPAASLLIGPAGGPYTCDFALARWVATDCAALAPDGSPAPGALVAFLPGDSRLDLSRLQGLWARTHVSQADDGGRFALPALLHLAPVAIVHDAGYLAVGSDEIAGAVKVRLKPWGRLAGVVRLAGKPAQGVGVTLELERHGSPEDVCFEFREESGPTGKDGRFAFDGIPAGIYVVGLAVEGAGESVSSHRTRVEVKPGRTRRVTVGGAGRPVTGRFVARFADTAAARVTGWEIELKRAKTAPVQPSGPLERLGHVVARWLNGPAKPGPPGPALGRLYEYAAAAEPDGEFRIDDVPPGQYTLTVRVRGIRMSVGGGIPYEEELVTWSRGLEVPRGPRAEPLDLGDMPVRLAP